VLGIVHQSFVMFEQEMGEKCEATENQEQETSWESCQPAVSPQRKMSEAHVKHVRECRANENPAPKEI